MDARDGVNGNPIWKDRSGNGNNATLNNFSQTKESGFNGKRLVFDGIDDKLILKNPILTNYTLFIKGKINDNSVINRIIGKEFITGRNQIALTIGNKTKLTEPNISDYATNLTTPTEFELVVVVSNSKDVKVIMNRLDNTFSFTARNNFNTWENMYNDETSTRLNVDSIKLYNRVLSDEEIEKNLVYERLIDRTIPTTYPLIHENKDYCIGETCDLTEEKKRSFRLSIDKSKFVSGVNNVGGIEVETYTHSETKSLMETPEWKAKEEVI